MRGRALFFFGVASVLACACGGAEKGFDGHVYRDGRIAFRVGDVPSTWHRIEVTDASLAFRDDTHQASILLNARCGQRDDDVPLVSLTGQLIMGTTDRDYGKEETIPFDGREARHTTLKAKLDGVLLSYDIYVEKKDGCIYDFVYVAPPDQAASSAEFERFVGDFHTIGTEHEIYATSGSGS